jgi:hypothetical protein
LLQNYFSHPRLGPVFSYKGLRIRTDQNQIRNIVLSREATQHQGYPNQLLSDSWAVDFEEGSTNAALWITR